MSRGEGYEQAVHHDPQLSGGCHANQFHPLKELILSSVVGLVPIMERIYKKKEIESGIILNHAYAYSSGLLKQTER
jgi:hypothetical protein